MAQDSRANDSCSTLPVGVSVRVAWSSTARNVNQPYLSRMERGDLRCPVTPVYLALASHFEQTALRGKVDGRVKHGSGAWVRAVREACGFKQVDFIRESKKALSLGEIVTFGRVAASIPGRVILGDNPLRTIPRKSDLRWIRERDARIVVITEGDEVPDGAKRSEAPVPESRDRVTLVLESTDTDRSEWTVAVSIGDKVIASYKGLSFDDAVGKARVHATRSSDGQSKVSLSAPEQDTPPPAIVGGGPGDDATNVEGIELDVAEVVEEELEPLPSFEPKMNILALHRRMAGGKHVYVQDGKLFSENGEAMACTPTELEDGVYRIEGRGFVRDLSSKAQPSFTQRARNVLGHLTFSAPCRDLALAAQIARSEHGGDQGYLNYIVIQAHGDGTARVYGCNGRALAAFTVEAHSLKKGRYFVPSDLVRSILREPNAQLVRITFDHDRVSVENGFVLLTARIPNDLEVVDYERLIPRDVKHVWALDKKKFATALKAIKPYTESSGTRVVELHADNKDVVVRAGANRDNPRARGVISGEVSAGGTLQFDKVFVSMPAWREDAPEGDDLLSLNLSHLEALVKASVGTRIQIGITTREHPYVFNVS